MKRQQNMKLKQMLFQVQQKQQTCQTQTCSQKNFFNYRYQTSNFRYDKMIDMLMNIRQTNTIKTQIQLRASPYQEKIPQTVQTLKTSHRTPPRSITLYKPSRKLSQQTSQLFINQKLFEVDQTKRTRISSLFTRQDDVDTERIINRNIKKALRKTDSTPLCSC
ncbi:hypothetical protein pb186bvf_001713 [Paramecium bursaria]